MGFEEKLAHPDQVKQLAHAQQLAEIAEAEARELRAWAEAAELLDQMDPVLIATVAERYGDRGLNRLVDISRRAEAGPARPGELEIRPTQDPERFPEPPKRLPPHT
jgi:hypothetical protein